jgi:hypothetical protein
MPHPVSPVANSQMAAGSHTTGAPTGRIEMTPAITPSSTGRGTPEIHRPSAVRKPCATAVPSSP